MTPIPTAALPTAAGAASSAPAPAATQAVACLGPILSHQARELEALLPHEVDGRTLTSWSLVGRCWIEGTFTDPATIDPFLGQFGQLELPKLRFAMAGRTDEKMDPPYFVHGAAWAPNTNESDLTMIMLLGGAGFSDIYGAAALQGFEERTVGGKSVWVGSAAMLTQDEHQRGKPYIYQADDTIFVIVTDAPAWAEEAIRKLP